MKWTDKFVESTDHFAGEAVAKEMMESIGELRSGSSPHQKADWIKNAIEKLEALVNEETMRKIMIATCPHTYPKGRIQKLRKQFKRLGTINRLLEIMRNDRSWKGRSYYDTPVRKGNVIYMTKVPCDPEAYQNAKIANERQLAYCHCPWVKAVISVDKKLSPIFCYCAAGWDKQLWEGILEKPVKVEVKKSLLQGDSCCTHVIHLPSGVK